LPDTVTSLPALKRSAASTLRPVGRVSVRAFSLSVSTPAYDTALIVPSVAVAGTSTRTDLRSTTSTASVLEPSANVTLSIRSTSLPVIVIFSPALTVSGATFSITGWRTTISFSEHTLMPSASAILTLPLSACFGTRTTMRWRSIETIISSSSAATSALPANDTVATL